MVNLTSHLKMPKIRLLSPSIFSILFQGGSRQPWLRVLGDTDRKEPHHRRLGRCCKYNRQLKPRRLCLRGRRRYFLHEVIPLGFSSGNAALPML